MVRNLDIATLRALQAVAEYGGVTRAAEALNLTQSALSMQIKRLEEIFGHPMLTRQGRGVVLSGSAVELLAEGRKLVAHNDAIMAKFLDRRARRRLRVGLSSDWLFPKVAVALRAFREAHPQIDLVISDGRSKELRQELARGDHDLIVTTDFSAPPGVIHLAKVDLGWFGAVDGQAWRERPLPIAVTAFCAYFPIAVAALERAGIAWEQIGGSNYTDTWRVLIVADLGVTIRPFGVAQTGVEAVEHGGALPPLPPTWLNALIAEGPMQGAAIDFVEHLRPAIGAMAVS